MKKSKVLLIEDEDIVSKLIIDFLSQRGTNVVLVLKQQLGMHKAPPIIAVTARASVVDEQYAKKMGCDAFVTKPIDPVAFVALVNGFLRTSEEEQN